MSDRVRVNSLGAGIVLLSPRPSRSFTPATTSSASKSLDANSYNGGDWFNRIDFHVPKQ